MCRIDDWPCFTLEPLTVHIESVRDPWSDKELINLSFVMILKDITHTKIIQKYN